MQEEDAAKSSEERKAKLREKEEKRKQEEQGARERIEAAKRECAGCFEKFVVGQGLDCHGEDRHFLCDTCFGATNMEHQLSGDWRGHFTANHGKIVCQWCWPKHVSFFSDKEIAMHVTEEAYAQYRQGQDELTEVKAYRQAETRFQTQMAEIREQMLKAVDSRQQRVYQHRLHIAENILTLKCPRCAAAIFDFTGCFAVTCNLCRCGFCAWCLADCGADAHAHVLTCAHTLRPGQYHATLDEFNQVHRARRRAAVVAYLEAIPDEQDKRSLLELLRPDLNDLGIQL